MFLRVEDFLEQHLREGLGVADFGKVILFESRFKFHFLSPQELLLINQSELGDFVVEKGVEPHFEDRRSVRISLGHLLEERARFVHLDIRKEANGMPLQDLPIVKDVYLEKSHVLSLVVELLRNLLEFWEKLHAVGTDGVVEDDEHHDGRVLGLLDDFVQDFVVQLEDVDGQGIR